MAGRAAAVRRYWRPVREGVAVLVEDGVIRRVAVAAEPCPEGARLRQCHG